jgi:RNA polymerase sigma-70 factor (ECF subfamily)
VNDAAIRAQVEAGDLAAATTALLRGCGTELLDYLQAIARDDDLGAEAFAELCEDLWRGLPKFRWEASLRTWLYALARNALGQLRRDPRRRPERNVPLSIAPEVAAVARTITAEYRRTEVKDGFRALRDELDAEEQELLLLRVDRQLSWNDIARIFGGADADADAAAARTRAATLRKRFERAKERLRKRAEEKGLVG